MKWLNETTLTGKSVTLVPLKRSHSKDLLKAAADGELWNLWYTTVPSEKTIDAYLNYAFEQFEADKALPFAVIKNDSQTLVGTTRYMNATPHHKRLEIGSTWYAKSVQKTGINTECKYLLLRHAFEQLNSIAVEFRTHWHNSDSRRAIQRLGARQDGVLRNHQITRDGTYRDTVVFSIIDGEWPTVKQSLEFKLNR